MKCIKTNISKLAQFAVHVFFMIAGYYAFGCPIETIRRRLFKIIKIFIFSYKSSIFMCGIYSICDWYFLLGVNNPSVSLNKHIEYIGDKLSLNVYIFHVLIGGAIGIVWNHIQTTACADKVFAWMLPIITVVIAVLWAYLLEKGKVVLKKRRVRG